MVAESTPHGLEIGWKDGSLELRVKVGDDGAGPAGRSSRSRPNDRVRCRRVAEPLGDNLG